MYKKRSVFIAACAGMLLFGICLVSLGSLTPGLKEKFLLDNLASGTLFSILPLGILAGSIIFGPVVDRRGYKVLLSASCIILGIGFEGITLATAPGILKLFILLIGLGGGAINGATNSLVSDISESDKRANLSFLGVFFGIRALGMPLVLGILEKIFSFESILSAISILSLFTGVAFILVKQPQPKQSHGFRFKTILTFLKDKMLLLIALFLFFQSSFEGIMNNWTTSYMLEQMNAPKDISLFTLSLFVAGMTIMRLLAGSVLRNVPLKKTIALLFALVIMGIILIKTSLSLSLVMTGFLLIGAGLAYGFPTMLGFTGERYAELSGTAFSFVLFIALLGNTSMNYAMGVISQNFGITNMVTVTFGITVILITLFFVIIKKLKT
jgi:MFS transporter, FHS family, glucose/mannose:H+ symporter